MRVHELKIWPEPFEAIRAGAKRHEVRIDDRGFAVGDELLLREFDPSMKSTLHPDGDWTGGFVHARVTYITHGGTWGLPPGLCVMSIDAMSTEADV